MRSNTTLTEFDLDAPTLPREVRQSFRYQTRHITSLYERLFKPFRIQEKAWKVLVEIVPVVTKPQVRDLLGVLTFQVRGDPTDFAEAPESSKPKMALDWLASGAIEVAKAHNWSTKPFQDAAAAVVEAEFVNKWLWMTHLWNQSKTLFCDVEVEHGLRETKISAIFKNADGLLIWKSALCSTAPCEFAFVPLLGKACWIDEWQVKLVSKDGKQRWLAAPTPDLPPEASRG